MKAIILALLALCMFAPCLAEPQTVTSGPYAITFDLGIPKDYYSVEVSEPKTKESLAGDISTIYYIAHINDTNLMRRATIQLREYSEDQPQFTPSELVTLVKSTLEQSGVSDVQAANRIIDGVNGGIASGTGSTDIWVATYRSTACLDVSLVSNLPWDEGTLLLLKTIHVAKTIYSNNNTWRECHAT